MYQKAMFWSESGLLSSHGASHRTTRDVIGDPELSQNGMIRKL